MESVCVTGAGGFLASWVVKELLAKGYVVHATVRNIDDEKKNGHLKKLKHANERLRHFKADLLDYASLCIAIDGCIGVMHVATPVPAGKVADPLAKILQPAIIGTRNVMNACLKNKVKKVVVVSSFVAILSNPSWPKGQAMDETCWSDAEFCMSNEKWYSAAKTIAEQECIDFGKKNNINVVTVCPSVVFGPMLQSILCATNTVLLKLLKGEYSLVEVDKVEQDMDVPIVDVRDCANALLLVYEKPEAEGRYLCSSNVLKTMDLAKLLKNLFPQYNYPTDLPDSNQEMVYTCKKLMNLGWNYTPLEKTLVDSVISMQENGLLH
ncbi:cinnamoyl-CoA reductase 1-like [Rutidosis leptorrhynchoides]|uniref:cinnamoyl-CoA reductase 1-like n=1 Tax=Rutidosis leptorrhynchoides TaxID=125765 RepID=UPI003A9A0317